MEGDSNREGVCVCVYIYIYIHIYIYIISSVQSLSRVRLFATASTETHQAPPSMGFSRQEYWSGVPLPSPDVCTPMVNCGFMTYIKIVKLLYYM